MHTKARIQSVLHTAQLSETVTGVPSFELKNLQLPSTLDFELPTNLRLGHLAERVVAGALHAARNYHVVYENVQIKQGNTTLGELDFILQNKETNALVHMELAYKFYLYDPSIANEPVKNWIGPNRNDSLVQKLDKLHTKQFQLLHSPEAQAQFTDLQNQPIAQQLCLLTNLFVPLGFDVHQIPQYQYALTGYYVDYASFLARASQPAQYYVPKKKAWGMDPQSAPQWEDFQTVQPHIAQAIEEQQAPLVWVKINDGFEQLFVVWW